MPSPWTPTSALGYTVYAAGFLYDPDQDIIYTRMDAPQRSFGYAFGYDVAALGINAVIDCEPIFFDYGGKHWMIEMWKGQYGLETGCEIGVYTRPIGSTGLGYALADATVGPRPGDAVPSHNLFFDCASDLDRLQLSATLRRDGTTLFTRGPELHWWLTGFKWGVLSDPSQLSVDVVITLKDDAMRDSFIAGIAARPYSNLTINGTTVSFTFDQPFAVPQPARPAAALAAVKANNKVIVDTYNSLGFPNNDPNHVEAEFLSVAGLGIPRLADYLGTIVSQRAIERGDSASSIVPALADAFSVSGSTIEAWLSGLLREGAGIMNSVFETLTDWVDGALTDPNPLLKPVTGTGDVESTLATLHQRVADVATSADINDWISKADAWFAAIGNVANAAFVAPQSLDQLIVRVIQSRIPRLSATLVLLDVITATPEGGQRIDWERLGALASHPNQLVDEAFWDDLLASSGQPSEGRRIAVLIALTLLAPQTILALERGDLSVAPLPSPSARSGGAWQAFRARTQDWLSVTIPIGDPTKPAPNPRSTFDWVSGIQPDLGITAAGRTTRVPAGAGHRTDFELWLAIGIEGDYWELGLGNGWTLRVEPGVTVGFGKVGGSWHGAFRQFLVDSNRLPGAADPVEVTVRRDPAKGVPDVLLGPPYDTRLEIRDISGFLRLREQSPIAELGFEIKGLALIVTNRWFRTFGVTDSYFREGLRYESDVVLSWAEGVGFRLGISSAFEVLIVIPANIGKREIGPFTLQLHDIRLRIPIDAANGEARTRIEIRVHASISIGNYVVLTMDGAGVWVGFFGHTWKESLGDPSSPREVFGFIPPTGAGIEISINPITGGGYLERKTLQDGAERWAGVLRLGLWNFSLVGLGIWERQLTGDTSFIVVIGVRFSAPGIQIGYGFTITGFGGMLGIDRRVDSDALRERLTSGAAGNVLFPDDPIRNAPTIIGDLGSLFPARKGVVVAGPTAQLKWLNFAQLDIGIVLEFAGPALTKVILMGSLRGGIPGKDSSSRPLLQLRIDILGVLDLPKRTLEFDASLIDSMALDVFHITGDAAFRLSWGDEPYVLLSVGGFHPAFDPKGVIVPDLTRVALTLNPGFLDFGIFVRAEAYFAITTNSFQLGTRLELGLTLGPLNILGFLAFDALVQVSPFHFDIRFSVGMAVRFRALTLAGVTLSGTLSGPGPVVLFGRACIEVLFFEICASGERKLGGNNRPAVQAAESPVQSTAQELRAENLRAQGSDHHVRLRPAQRSTGEALVSPNGQLIWSQTKIPLELTLDRVNGQPLPKPQAISASSPNGQGAADDVFAPGQFLELSDAEALNLPAFQRMQSGLRLGFGQRSARVTRVHTVTYETIRLPERMPVPLVALFLPAALLDAVAARRAVPAAEPAPAHVTVRPPTFSVYDATGARIDSGRTAADAFRTAKATGGVAVADGDVIEVGAF